MEMKMGKLNIVIITVLTVLVVILLFIVFICVCLKKKNKGTLEEIVHENHYYDASTVYQTDNSKVVDINDYFSDKYRLVTILCIFFCYLLSFMKT